MEVSKRYRIEGNTSSSRGGQGSKGSAVRGVRADKEEGVADSRACDVAMQAKSTYGSSEEGIIKVTKAEAHNAERGNTSLGKGGSKRAAKGMFKYRYTHLDQISKELHEERVELEGDTP